LQAQGYVRRHETEDVVVVKIGNVVEQPSLVPTPTPSPNVSPGSPPIQKPFKIEFFPGVNFQPPTPDVKVVSVSLDDTKTFADVLVGNDAMIFGFPVSIGIKENPQFDYLHPLLRKGLIAGEDLFKRSIIIDCPVYRGNSGGPVFQIEHEGFGYRISLIGIIIEYVPFSEHSDDFVFYLNSGYSIAKPVDFIADLVNAPSPPLTLTPPTNPPLQ
jgi:hypothetical protein